MQFVTYSIVILLHVLGVLYAGPLPTETNPELTSTKAGKDLSILIASLSLDNLHQGDMLLQPVSGGVSDNYPLST